MLVCLWTRKLLPSCLSISRRSKLLEQLAVLWIPDIDEGCAQKWARKSKIRVGRNKDADKYNIAGAMARKRTCEQCTTGAAYNEIGKPARFCDKHRSPGMVDVTVSRACAECSAPSPRYNLPGCKPGKFCKTHKQEGMIDVTRRTCEVCTSLPSFNFKGMRPARFCEVHKLHGMENVVSRKCESCNTQPLFNMRGLTPARFCATHKLEGMVNVVNKLCLLCDQIPSYGKRGETKATYCQKHKEDGMVNLYGPPKCESCGRIATFNVKTERAGRFCSRHKLAGMIDVKERRGCEECGKRPGFNFVGGKPRFCVTHKLPGMEDVRNNKCACKAQATWGLPGQKATFCSQHRREGTLRYPRKRCVEPGCNDLAKFGSSVHEHCETHRISGEVNIMEQRCKSCTLLGIVDADGNCETCDPAAFKRIRLAKQNMVRDFLLAQGVPLTSVDRMIDGGECGKERPDFFIDCDTHILIIEVDEHQHSGRACECEQTRMVKYRRATACARSSCAGTLTLTRYPRGRRSTPQRSAWASFSNGSSTSGKHRRRAS